MARRPGPLDHGQRISTQELLENVDQHGPQWPAALSGYTLEAVSVAVGREIMAGNLVDGAHLSAQGRATLAHLRGAPAPDGTPAGSAATMRRTDLVGADADQAR